MSKHLVLLLAVSLLAAQPVYAGASYGTPFPTAIGGTGITATNGFSQAFPTARPPGATDDGAHGYSVGDLWLFGGKVYQAKAVGTGIAVWQLQTAPYAPVCDLLGTPCKAAYGTYKLRTAYAGNAFSVTRASDSTTSAVGFDTFGNANCAAVDAFCVGTTCSANTWYDQSGNAYDLAQATAANQPLMSGVKVGTACGITFWGNTVSLTNTSVPVTNVQTVSILATMVAVGNNAANGNALLELGNATRKVTFEVENYSTYKLLEIDSAFGSFRFNSGIKSQQPLSLLLVNNGGTLSLTQNNQALTSAGPVTSSASTGLQVGKSSFSNPAGETLSSLIVWDAALSAADQKTVIQAADLANGIQPQETATVIAIGDSISCCIFPTTGPYATDSIFYGQLAKLLVRPANVLNYGMAGELASQMATDSTAIAALSVPSGATKIAIVEGGSNDLAAASQTAAQVYANDQTVCANVRAAGAKCVVLSLPPRNGLFTNGVTGTTFETARQAHRALLAANWPTFADGYVDLAADPVIGPSSAAANALYFLSTDQTHPTPLGNTYIAADIARVVNPLLQ